ncbi:hypothetical protein TNCV_2608011 [Trichonephila clavipes]|uniref:Uncharacterized protein n=1 Tax=Trichonephila clavipes TaxID=2585209 RepID=A0A8X6RYR3_TRICX|nr:hypothetical protein TNCV_2608011 [Trichonephila clavipes]
MDFVTLNHSQVTRTGFELEDGSKCFHLNFHVRSLIRDRINVPPALWKTGLRCYQNSNACFNDPGYEFAYDPCTTMWPP